MKNVLVAYFSHSGKTAQMAEYIAEGIRFKGHQASVKPIAELKSPADMAGYDGYIFGSPTYSLDIPGPMKSFMELAGKSSLEKKKIGSFGAYRHEVSYQPGGVAAEIILDKMSKEYHMEPFSLGPFRLKEDLVDTVEGMRACQDYGKVFGEQLGA